MKFLVLAVLISIVWQWRRNFLFSVKKLSDGYMVKTGIAKICLDTSKKAIKVKMLWDSRDIPFDDAKGLSCIGVISKRVDDVDIFDKYDNFCLNKYQIYLNTNNYQSVEIFRSNNRAVFENASQEIERIFKELGINIDLNSNFIEKKD